MPVIIHHQDLFRFTFDFQTSPDSFDLFQGLFDHFKRNSEFQARGNACQGIENIVLAGQIENNISQIPVSLSDRESALSVFKPDLSGLEVCLGRQTVGGMPDCDTGRISWI